MWIPEQKLTVFIISVRTQVKRNFAAKSISTIYATVNLYFHTNMIFYILWAYIRIWKKGNRISLLLKVVYYYHYYYSVWTIFNIIITSKNTNVEIKRNYFNVQSLLTLEKCMCFLMCLHWRLLVNLVQRQPIKKISEKEREVQNHHHKGNK